MTPVTPFWIMSPTPFTRVATQGTLAAMASNTTLGMPSWSEDSRKMSAAQMSSRASGTLPRKRTLSSSPRDATWYFNSSRQPRSFPAIAARTVLCRPTLAIVSMKRSKRF